MKFHIIFAFLLFYLPRTQPIEIFINALDMFSPQIDPTAICSPIGSKTCLGTVTSPFDNIAYAFQAALLTANVTQDQTVVFSLMASTSPTAYFPYITSEVSQTLISPFEYFTGHKLLFN